MHAEFDRCQSTQRRIVFPPRLIDTIMDRGSPRYQWLSFSVLDRAHHPLACRPSLRYFRLRPVRLCRTHQLRHVLSTPLADPPARSALSLGRPWALQQVPRIRVLAPFVREVSRPVFLGVLAVPLDNDVACALARRAVAFF